MSHGKTSTHTFRLDSAILDALMAESNEGQISLNALAGQILEDYAKVGRFAKRAKVLHFGPPVVKSILEEIPDDTVKRLSTKLGQTHPKEALASIGLPLTLENALLHIENLSRHARWYEQPNIVKEREWSIHMAHGVCEKWSVFLCSYLAALFESLDFRVIDTNCTDHSATLRLQPPTVML